MTESQKSEAEWFEIAKNSSDRKIYALDNLAKTTNPEIKHWMVRRGWADSAYLEDAVVICITTGDLLAELKKAHPDKEVLACAGEAIALLVNGFGHSNITHYPDAAEATLLYLQHISVDPDLSIDHLQNVAQILDLVTGKHYGPNWNYLVYDWDDLDALGWTIKRCHEIAEVARTITKRPEWKERILSAMDGEDESQSFGALAFDAKSIGIDVWPNVLHRQISRQEDHWLFLIETREQARIDRLMILASEEEGASSEKLEDQASNLARRFVALNYAGICSDLILATLKSKESHKQNFAITVLAASDQAFWSEKAKQELRDALAAESVLRARLATKTFKNRLAKKFSRLMA